MLYISFKRYRYRCIVFSSFHLIRLFFNVTNAYAFDCIAVTVWCQYYCCYFVFFYGGNMYLTLMGCYCINPLFFVKQFNVTNLSNNERKRLNLVELHLVSEISVLWLGEKDCRKTVSMGTFALIATVQWIIKRTLWFHILLYRSKFVLLSKYKSQIIWYQSCKYIFLIRKKINYFHNGFYHNLCCCYAPGILISGTRFEFEHSHW